MLTRLSSRYDIVKPIAARAIYILVVALVLTGCTSSGAGDGGNASNRLAEILASAPELQVLPPQAGVVDRGQLRPCQAGSRSDRWGENAVVFETADSFESVTEFYRSQLSDDGWTMVDTPVGPKTVIFTIEDPSKPYRIRLFQFSSDSRRYTLMAEAPPPSRCS